MESQGAETVPEYPLLVVRLVAAVYAKVAVVFEGGGTTGVVEPLHVPVARPRVDGCLTPAARKATIRAAIRRARSTGLKHCLVLEPGRSLYITAAGEVTVSDGRPDTRLGQLVRG